jgi:general L-amino acid transport system permease protein
LSNLRATFRNASTWLAQLCVLAAIAGLVYWIGSNTAANLAKQSTASGFDFLNYRAGFGISQTLIDYSEDSSYGRVLLVGLLNTLLVAVCSIFLATLLGFLIGIGRLSQNWLINKLAMIYIEIFRNVPLLLQIMFWYFGVLRNLPGPRQAMEFAEAFFLSNRGFAFPTPILDAGSGIFLTALAISILVFVGAKIYQRRIKFNTGVQIRVWPTCLAGALVLLTGAYIWVGIPVRWDVPAMAGFNFRGGGNMIPEFVALVIGLSFYTAAFIAEIVRAGIQSVAKGQTEAARALAMPEATTLRLIIIPQALRVIIPPLTSQYLNLTKNSSLAVAIAYPDIVSVFAGTTLNQVGQAVEIIFITMMIYLSLSLITSLLMNLYNRRLAMSEAR